jgi:hypothetical protein
MNTCITEGFNANLYKWIMHAVTLENAGRHTYQTVLAKLMLVLLLDAPQQESLYV